MPLRTIVVAASGGTANEGAVEIALRLAKRFSAHLEAFHVRVDPRDIVMMASDGFGMPVSGEWIDQLIADAKTLADKTKAAFVAAAENTAWLWPMRRFRMHRLRGARTAVMRLCWSPTGRASSTLSCSAAPSAWSTGRTPTRSRRR